MMRYLVAFMLFTTACADVPSSGLHYDSVRDRLSEAPTWLYVHDDASFGTVTARRRGDDGWISGTTKLAIQNGHLRVAYDDSGQLRIDQLEIAVAAITMDRMFDKPAQLEDVGLRLAAPVRGEPAWTSDDDATASLTMVFDFGGALAFNGGSPVRLVTQRRPLENVEVALTGTGDHVEALLDVDSTGELWNWDGRVEITEVALSLTAETAD